MPYVVQKEGPKKWVVKKKGTNKKFGTHPTKAKAEAQQRALYANEKGR